LIAAFALLYNISSAKAVSVGQVYDAIGKVKNVHITQFSNETNQLVSERWVSRSLKIYMAKTSKETVLSDLSKGIRKVKRNDTGQIETSDLPQEFVASIESAISSSFGLVPFNDLTNLPAGAQWQRETDEHQEPDSKLANIYNLIWSRKLYGGAIFFINGEYS